MAAMRRPAWALWSPAAVLWLGVGLVARAGDQARVPLRAPLAEAVPETIAGYVARDARLSEGEVRLTGVSAYLVRVYERHDDRLSAAPAMGSGSPSEPGDAGTAGVPPETPARVTLYVGYYDSQAHGKTIHSPKNCLPGAGWEVLGSRTVEIATDRGTVRVNRYVLQRGEERALVLYWYQGRGRVEADEYRVKWNLLRDAALYGRSEEALVRLWLPLDASSKDADALAARLAAPIIESVETALPVSP